VADDSRLLKQCPDCAESVLAAARKCRFCGYRFDAASSSPQVDRPASGLLGLLFPSPATLNMSEVLTQLGVDLANGERLAGLWFGQVDHVDVYVVVTNTRLVVVEQVRRPGGSFPALEYPLNGLVDAEIVRHHMRTRLVVRWQHGGNTVISKLPAKDLAQLYRILKD
jgi:Uncharacterised protein family UPF0547